MGPQEKARAQKGKLCRHATHAKKGPRVSTGTFFPVDKTIQTREEQAKAFTLPWNVKDGNFLGWQIEVT